MCVIVCIPVCMCVYIVYVCTCVCVCVCVCVNNSLYVADMCLKEFHHMYVLTLDCTQYEQMYVSVCVYVFMHCLRGCCQEQDTVTVHLTSRQQLLSLSVLKSIILSLA